MTISKAAAALAASLLLAAGPQAHGLWAEAGTGG